MQESKKARIGTLCALYFSQGVPWAFITVAFVTYLRGHDTFSITDDQVVALTFMGMLPWMFGKLLLGPVIDRFQFKSMGRRRPWVLISQLGMVITIAAFLLVENPESDLKKLGLFFFIHNIFAVLQDVSSDALAVDLLSDDEVAMANGLMFIFKGFGMMFAALVLGNIMVDSGFQSALLIQVPVLLLLMLIPLFVLEKPGDGRFPWSSNSETSNVSMNQDAMKFGEIFSGIKQALSNATARWALLLSLVMWIGGGMGAGMGMIDVQMLFIFQDDGNTSTWDLGWSEEDYLALKGGLIALTTMIGFLVGGLLGSKFGTHKVMMYGVGIGTILTIIWSAGRSSWSDDSFMQSMWIVWTFVWGVVGANLIAMLMSITTKDLGGTQFSIYMTAINIGALLGMGASPKILDMLDDSFPNLFLVGALFQALVFLILTKIDMSILEKDDSVLAESE